MTTGADTRVVRRSVRGALAAALGAAALVAVAPGASSAQVAAGSSSLDGTTAADAAASCWEIKQEHPASSDGVYWLRNDDLERPERFWCDMTTDGGGWVLIGRGREGWTFRDYGQNTPESIWTDPTGPAAFSPAALDTATIDALLGGGDVADLADGIRLRRATDVAGTGWQEVRWDLLDLTSWSWAFGGGHRIETWSIDGATGTGSNTKSSATTMPGEIGAGNPGDDELGWFTFPWSSHGYLAGFSFRGSVDGQNNATSYLWERANEDNAIPFTQVYLRPQLTTGILTPIPDTGTLESTQTPLLDDRPLEIAGGVLGVRKNGDSEPALDTPVQTFATLGDRVYVGGKFDDVRDASTGQLVDQNYLAAFDRQTGAWISSFTPQLDGTVWDLTVADGRLVVAGQFTNVDGAPLTAGLAALDPVTGAVDPDWSASLTLSGSSARPYVRAVDVADGWIYVGGNFTMITHRFSDGSTLDRNTGRLARVRVADGYPDNQFLPNVDGTIYDLDQANGRVHVVGDFDGVNRASNANDPGDDPVNNDQGVSTLDATDGSVVAGYLPADYTTPNVSRQYQQSVLALGGPSGEVWQGGSEHNVDVYDATDYSLEKRWVTAGNGGDTQAFAVIDGVVYQGSHGNSWLYEDAVTWPQLVGYSRTDDYKWVGAFDVATREYVASWVPSLRSLNTEGAWALHADVDGCLWFGGDFLGGPFVNGQRQYLESFSKFCPRDIVAPSVPATAGASVDAGGGMRIDWTASTDDRPGFVGYEILRNDRVVSPLVYGQNYTDPSGTPDDRYFVRAVDAAGNRSASSGLIVPGDNLPPSTPQNLAAVVNPDQSVDLSWDASTDDVGVVLYQVLRNGADLVDVAGDTTTVNLPDLGPGSHWLQVRAVDGSGNESFKTPPVRVDLDGPDTQRPTQPGSPTAVVEPDFTITFSWSASSDDTGVTGYTVRRNLVEVATVDADTLSVDLDLGFGTHYLQVEAFDAAGNVSYRTAPIQVDVVDAAADTSPPSTPGGLVAVQGAGVSIDVSWTASTDDVGVAGYLVFRNNVVVADVAGDVTSTNLTGLGAGSHWIQVRAYDAAGNEGFKTPPVQVILVDPVNDTSPPSTPGGLVAVQGAGVSIDVSWTASTDDVGVAGYLVFRNNVVVADVAGDVTSTNLTGLGAGSHWIQVRAYDAAGNEGFKTPPVQVILVDDGGGPDTTPPSFPGTPTAVVEADDTVTVSWGASVDDVGVESYRVLRNLVEVALVASPDTSVNVDLGPGTHYIQVQAIDAAGNESGRTAPIVVTV